MNLDWMDIAKLTIPLFTALMTMWIKVWVDRYLSVRSKQHALSRLISDEFGNAIRTIKSLKEIGLSASNGNLRLVSVDISDMISKLSNDLVELDPKCAYCYGGLASSLALVNKGLARLSALTLTRANLARDGSVLTIDRAIHGQSKITAGDYISFCKAALMVLNIIPIKNQFNSDPQSMFHLNEMIIDLRDERAGWPVCAAPTPTPTQ